MKKIESLKSDINTMHDLENLTSMLEQTAARTIAQMRVNILDSRAYFREVWRIHRILKELTPASPEVVHKHLVVGIGIDWGMPGNLLNRVMDRVTSLQKKHEADILIAGKMAHGRFRAQDDHTTHLFSAPKHATLEDIQPIYKVVASYAHVTIVYPSFDSLSKQDIQVASFSLVNNEEILDANKEKAGDANEIDTKRFIIDPNPQELANYMNEAIVGLTVHHYFSESILAYSAAQMVAMRNGHDNAKNEAEKLRVKYNRARREVIDSKLRELYGSRAAFDSNKSEEPSNDTVSE